MSTEPTDNGGDADLCEEQSAERPVVEGMRARQLPGDESFAFNRSHRIFLTSGQAPGPLLAGPDAPLFKALSRARESVVVIDGVSAEAAALLRDRAAVVEAGDMICASGTDVDPAAAAAVAMQYDRAAGMERSSAAAPNRGNAPRIVDADHDGETRRRRTARCTTCYGRGKVRRLAMSGPHVGDFVEVDCDCVSGRGDAARAPRANVRMGTAGVRGTRKFR